MLLKTYLATSKVLVQISLSCGYEVASSTHQDGESLWEECLNDHVEWLHIQCHLFRGGSSFIHSPISQFSFCFKPLSEPSFFFLQLHACFLIVQSFVLLFFLFLLWFMPLFHACREKQRLFRILRYLWRLINRLMSQNKWWLMKTLRLTDSKVASLRIVNMTLNSF